MELSYGDTKVLLAGVSKVLLAEVWRRLNSFIHFKKTGGFWYIYIYKILQSKQARKKTPGAPTESPPLPNSTCTAMAARPAAVPAAAAKCAAA